LAEAHERKARIDEREEKLRFSVIWDNCSPTPKRPALRAGSAGEQPAHVLDDGGRSGINLVLLGPDTVTGLGMDLRMPNEGLGLSHGHRLK
jgi:hypothetical protein